jgi:hypothetical protein
LPQHRPTLPVNLNGFLPPMQAGDVMPDGAKLVRPGWAWVDEHGQAHFVPASKGYSDLSARSDAAENENAGRRLEAATGDFPRLLNRGYLEKQGRAAWPTALPFEDPAPVALDRREQFDTVFFPLEMAASSGELQRSEDRTAMALSRRIGSVLGSVMRNMGQHRVTAVQLAGKAAAGFTAAGTVAAGSTFVVNHGPEIPHAPVQNLQQARESLASIQTDATWVRKNYSGAWFNASGVLIRNDLDSERPTFRRTIPVDVYEQLEIDAQARQGKDWDGRVFVDEVIDGFVESIQLLPPYRERAVVEKTYTTDPLDPFTGTRKVTNTFLGPPDGLHSDVSFTARFGLTPEHRPSETTFHATLDPR